MTQTTHPISCPDEVTGEVITMQFTSSQFHHIASSAYFAVTRLDSNRTNYAAEKQARLTTHGIARQIGTDMAHGKAPQAMRVTEVDVARIYGDLDDHACELERLVRGKKARRVQLAFANELHLTARSLLRLIDPSLPG